MIKPEISIIITNKNAYKWLNKCFVSINAQTYKKWEVIFVDNASTDQSVNFVRNMFPWAKIIENKRDLGFAGASNIGAKLATGKYLLFINTDAYLERDTLQKLALVLNKNPECHLAQLDQKKYNKRRLPGKYLAFSMDIFGYPIGYPIISEKRGSIFYADGAALVITKKLFLQLRGFDRKFYMYLEDMDLSWRARIMGEKINFLENVFVYHYAGGTSITTKIKNGSYITTTNRRYHAQKNNIRALIKNYSLPMLILTLPVSIFLASAEGFIYLFNRNVQGFFALHNAIFWNIINIFDNLKERDYVQSSRKINDLNIIKNMQLKISKIHSFFLHGVPSMKF